jgi:hypothetical protein
MNPRILGAILFVSVVSLLSVGRMFLQVADYYPQAPSPDGVTEFDSRFVALRMMLPPKGVIGYITDPDTPAADTNATAEYHLAQYALAPIVVVNSPEHRFVIGNFHKGVSTGSLRDRGFQLVREFGNGIVLLQNERVK